MTTPQAEIAYLNEHLREWGAKGYAVFNPNDQPLHMLPVIYGFNNGGSPGWYSGCLLAEDGTGMGGHVCSSEGYMPHDLGVLEGSRPDRHEGFREHYPEGYRMDFVPASDVRTHSGLEAAYQKNQVKAAEAASTEAVGDRDTRATGTAGA